MVISWLQHFYVTGYKELGYVKIRLVDSTSAQYLFKGGRNMIFVGIDVASDKHDFFITSSNGALYSKRSITINNNFLGYKKLHKSITEFCEATNDYIVRIGLESTGFYHLNITKFLLDNNFEVMIINPILTNMFKKSKKVHSPKTDNIDSQYICKYLEDNIKDFKPYTLISYHNEGLKSLSRERFYLVENIRQVKVSIYRVLTQLFPEYLKLFSNVYQGSALSIIERYPSPKKLSRANLKTLNSLIHGRCKITAEILINTAKNSIGIDNDVLSFQLTQLIKRLNSLNNEISEYDKMIKQYVDKTNPNILTIPGVGYTTAGLILGEIGDISRFKNSTHLTSFCGLDIEVYESGKFKATNHKISKKGSKYLRYALWQVAKVCWRSDPKLNAYYQKKKSENKHFFVILGHLQKKLIKIIYSILKNNTEYTSQ